FKAIDQPSGKIVLQQLSHGPLTSKAAFLFNDLREVKPGEQVYGKGLSCPPVRRYLQYCGSAEPPVCEEDVFLEGNLRIVHTGKHRISSQRGVPRRVFPCDGQRHESRCGRDDRQAEMSGNAQGEVGSAEFVHRQSPRSNNYFWAG